MKRETERQIMHFLIGIITIIMLFYFGRYFMIGAVFFVLLAGTVIINAKLSGMKAGVVEWFVDRFERKDALLPGFGSACYATGTMIPIVFLTDINQIAACIFILAVGDGMSTLAGRMGKIKLPYNRKKTAEGSLAFFISSLAAYFFVGPSIVLLAAFAAIVESINFEMDDNLTVPIACTAFLLVGL